MKTLLIETAYKNPKRYSVKNKLDTVLIIGEDEAVINKQPLHDVVEIIEYAYNNLLTEDGYILVRLVARDYGDVLSVFEERLPALLENYIRFDRIEFIAQCINEQIPKEYCAIPFVETLLIGIGSNKKPELKNKVRFISMTDKLVKLPDCDEDHPFYQWTFRDVPFTREECLAQQNYADVENSAITDLHSFNYVPLNNSQKNKDGIALGEFMELSGNNFQGVPHYWLDQERHYFGQTTFDLFTNYLIPTAGSPLPDPSWQVIDDDAIVFNNQDPTKIESLLIVQPSGILIPDNLDARDCMTAIQVKPEWKERVDIAYIYLETRKPEFLDQFYYYLNLRAGVAINSANILKAKIETLPSIEEQREIVRIEKEKHFAGQKANLESHQALLNFEYEKKSLSIQLGEIDEKINHIKRDMVSDDPILRNVISACDSIMEDRQDEVRGLLFYILPTMKCVIDGVPVSTSEVGNKARTVIEIVIQTLKSINAIPGIPDLGKCIDHICGDEVGSSMDITKELRNDLLKIKSVVNSTSHEGTFLSQEVVIRIISVLIELIGWLKEFTTKYSDLEQNFERWVEDFEQLTKDGKRTIKDVYGVITQEWRWKTKDNEPGEPGGAWIVQYGNYKTDIFISNELIKKYRLGFGSVVKVDVIKKRKFSGKERWETERVEVVNDCRDFHRYNSEYFNPKRILRYGETD